MAPQGHSSEDTVYIEVNRVRVLGLLQLAVYNYLDSLREDLIVLDGFGSFRDTESIFYSVLSRITESHSEIQQCMEQLAKHSYSGWTKSVLSDSIVVDRLERRLSEGP